MTQRFEITILAPAHHGYDPVSWVEEAEDFDALDLLAAIGGGDYDHGEVTNLATNERRCFYVEHRIAWEGDD